MKKSSVFITSIVFLVIVLSVIQVVVSNNLSTTGPVLSTFEQDLKTYKRENALLREKFLLASSLTNIASKAATLGFSEAKSQIVIKSSLPVALKP